jgi:intein/homing endonuclease
LYPEYVAGFFDGDGCLSIGTGTRKYFRTPNLYVTIIMNQKYISGFFDAEGHIKTGTNRRAIRPGANIQVLGSEVLIEIHKYLNDMGIRSNLNVNNRIGRLAICGIDNTANFLKLIFPYSIVKKKQIEIFIQDIYPLIRFRERKFRKKYSKLEFLAIHRAVDKLNSLKCRKSPNVKYTANYFRRRWHYKQRKNETGYLRSQK